MIRAHAPLAGGRALDVGCGVGLYTAAMAEAGAAAIGLEIEWPRAVAARQRGLAVAAAVGEALPFRDGAFDAVLLHEVLEHVADDARSLQEAVRVLRPGGRAVVFVPNRLWPFETHGVFWRGRYRFGNAPLVNYLPDALRNRLAPHVRVYTAGRLRALARPLPAKIVHLRPIYPGFDALAARRPRLARALRGACYALERTPLAAFGLSHLLVLERQDA